MNLEDRANDPVRKLSGGMVRRLGIAQALLGCPKIRLFDEPTAGLDPEERLRFKRLIQASDPARLTVISTHIVEDIEATCDHVIVLLEGKIAFLGTQSELAQLAAGLVYVVPASVYSPDADTFVIKETETDSERELRILTKQSEPYAASRVQPVIEDGYISLLKGFVSAG